MTNFPNATITPVRPAVNPGIGSGFSRKSYPGLSGVLREIKRLIQKFTGDPQLRDLAVKITAGASPDPRTGLPDRRNYDHLAQAIYFWMKRNIQYVRDPYGIEWLQSPDVTVKRGYGDCDDQAILGASLMSAIGIPTRLAVVKANPKHPDEFTHVYVEYQANGVWKPFDPTLHARAGVGIPENRILGRKTVSLDDFPLKKKDLS